MSTASTTPRGKTRKGGREGMSTALTTPGGQRRKGGRVKMEDMHGWH